MLLVSGTSAGYYFRLWTKIFSSDDRSHVGTHIAAVPFRCLD